MPPKAVPREITLEGVREDLCNGSVTARETALDNLSFLFDRKNNVSELSKIKEKGYHQLFDDLFKCALVEKQAYLKPKKTQKSKKSSVKTGEETGAKISQATITRLSKCAEALHKVVDHGGHKLRRKTLMALIDHIIETLPGPDGDIVQPLFQGYVKALCSLLGHASQVELLATYEAQGWYSCVDFILQMVEQNMDDTESDSGPSRASPAPGTTQFSAAMSTLRSSASSSNFRGGNQKQKTPLENLLQGLVSLVSASNAPLLQRSWEISSAMVKVLQFRSRSNVPLAFAVVNAILAVAQTDDIEHANSLTSELLPLASRWWPATPGKEDAFINNLQNEILKSVFIMRLNIECLVRRDQSIISCIEELCETLWNEYSRREDRAQFQQDDLTYSSIKQHEHAFKTRLFGLRLNHVQAERKWGVVHILALLEGILWRESHSRHIPVEGESEQPRKKRRTAEGDSRLRQKLRSMDDSVQFTALQILPFFVSSIGITASDMSESLPLLIGLTGHKNHKLAVWAMIASASIAQTRLAAHSSLLLYWKQLWTIATRTVSISGNCRASSILLLSIISNDLILYRDVSDDINSIVTTADVSGPAIAVDSSIILMTRLLELRNYQLPSASYATSNHVARWLFLRWDPADPTFIASRSAHVIPLDIVNLLRAAYGVPAFIPSGAPQAITGPLGETWGLLQQCEGIVDYLLLLETHQSALSTRDVDKNSTTDSAPQTAETSDSHATRKLIAELLHPKLEEVASLCDSWNKRGDKSSQISTEKLQSLFSCLVVVAFTIPNLKEVTSRQSQELEPALFNALQNTLRVILEATESRVLHESILRIIRPYLPAFATSDLGFFMKEHHELVRLFSELSEVWREKSTKQLSGDRGDPMDMDDGFEPQETRSSTLSTSLEIPRREMSMMDANSFYSDTTQRLHLLHVLRQDPGQIGLVPRAFLDDFLACSNNEFLCCRFLMQELLAGDLVISQDDAQRAVERMGEIIGSSSFSSCEVAWNTCIVVIKGLMPLWSGESNELSAVVGDLYGFFVSSALPHNLLSSNVQTALASLLLELTQVNEKFPESLRLPFTIETLYDILKEGKIVVKFFIGSHLSDVFKRYVLKMHDQVFLDVLKSLPSDPQAPEGIALRMFVLGELAQHWPTLLRRCIYHIFETPGSIPDSAKHATFCIRKVADTLKLENAQVLFGLFAPQILFTWLNQDSISDIPFEIFGFSDIQELLKHAQSEAAALMAMRAQDTDVAELAQSLGVSHAQLVQSRFSKILAYSMAHDISVPKPDQHVSGEQRIKKLLGREIFLQSVYFNLADIVGLFFTMVDQDDPVERSWSKDETFAYAGKFMAEIKTCGHSQVELPANQQPTFRAKFLTRQLSVLCSRTEYEMPHIWTPALVVAVARRLFNMIHPALGSLHACSVIRKVRMLICLAGSIAWGSYPLEMLLHSLRPWIVDSECADDALGMTQFLLMHGIEALSQSPSFLAGYALSTLASLRVFLESTQSSTTQESQYKATMGKAQKFHCWFSKYLEEYQPPMLQDHQQLAAFRAITHAASRIRSSGNAERATHESNLLLELLRNEESEEPLLNEPSRKLALDMLCAGFRLAPSLRTDAVNSDEEALDVATAVWKSSRVQSDSNEYLVWAGRVIGRSFAASGDIDQSLLRESNLTQYQKASLFSDISSSEQGLLSLLQSLTADANYHHAGLAESTLRNIVSEAAAQEDNTLLTACEKVMSPQLRVSSDWNPYRTPPSDNEPTDSVPESLVYAIDAIQESQWCQRLTMQLTQSAPENIVLSALPQILANVKGFAEKAFPFIVHLILLSEHNTQQSAKRRLSAGLKEWLRQTSSKVKDNLSLIINTLLYLRTQSLPGEASIADRTHWLDIDLSSAASAAIRCGMYKTALLFVESIASEGFRASRRSSAVRAQESTDVLLEIFENIDDPDAYYGLSNTASLSTVLSRLEYEKDSSKSLSFRGAQYDSHMRRKDTSASIDSQYLVSTLSNFGLSGLSHAVQTQQAIDGIASVDNTFSNARRLEIWNLPAPITTNSPSVMLYKAFQGCYQATASMGARAAIHNGLRRTMQNLVEQDITTATMRQNVGVLAALTELEDVLHVSDSTELDDMLTIFENRSKWMRSGRYADVSHILSCRETSLSMLGHSLQAGAMSDIHQPNAKLVEVKSMLLSSSVYRFHQATQETLNIATALNDLIVPSSDLGLTIDAAAKVEAANALWDHGEMMSSIGMLKGIDQDSDLKKQTVPVLRSDLLAKIGHQVSVARLEKPDSIHKNYLQPALKELKGKLDGREAGKVYHQFAMFCDEQLQNPDSLEDLARLQHLRQGKSDEVAELKHIISNERDNQKKARYQNYLLKAKQWLSLDEQELQRVEYTRNEFVRLSLENYLLSLNASDDHDNDTLRFTALWLERAGENTTNVAVNKYIDKVPTRKFAPLMNQLTSRLLDQSHLFQKLLSELVYRICVDHPYHGMYQIWSGVRTRLNKEDDASVLRQRAADRISKRLVQTEGVMETWNCINSTNKAYHGLAIDRDGRYKAGQKFAIKDSAAGINLVNSLLKNPIPPPTLQIELSASRDYSQVPYVVKLEPHMSIASGVSAPKIITLVGSNGERFKQLVKGGSDDLRQDAIMEQVFSAVSEVLKLHRSTQQRNLGIRTYKVLPLTSSSGLIEFVPNTIPLHEYLMPAHERYHPKDLKGHSCRKEISNAQSKSVDQRLSTYKKVIDRFRPVMHYFFMEYFVDPDEWYAKRTAYTRTTAAISILGHVLGLGDRHGHNILLDSQSGEAVHIDLGVAFEMGRILPVPETVPFRLTRDIVDGMGVTGTEGVFRRCCEFTLDALREETYSIMTILDVLRYDPLYSWSISPVRMAKLQNTRGDDESVAGPSESDVDPRKKKAGGNAIVNEPSEADRALEVVKKKLSKTLSVTATVNDLINQATDERNLAVLYSGWAAYA